MIIINLYQIVPNSHQTRPDLHQNSIDLYQISTYMKLYETQIVSPVSLWNVLEDKRGKSNHVFRGSPQNSRPSLMGIYFIFGAKWLLPSSEGPFHFYVFYLCKIVLSFADFFKI